MIWQSKISLMDKPWPRVGEGWEHDIHQDPLLPTMTELLGNSNKARFLSGGRTHGAPCYIKRRSDDYVGSKIYSVNQPRGNFDIIVKPESGSRLSCSIRLEYQLGPALVDKGARDTAQRSENMPRSEE